MFNANADQPACHSVPSTAAVASIYACMHVMMILVIVEGCADTHLLPFGVLDRIQVAPILGETMSGLLHAAKFASVIEPYKVHVPSKSCGMPNLLLTHFHTHPCSAYWACWSVKTASA
jgi:hypothetical protein